MSMKNTVEDRVKKVVLEYYSRHTDPREKVPAITNETSFCDDLNVDSLTTVELIILLEEEFDIQISDEQAVDMKTVQNVVDAITNIFADKDTKRGQKWANQ